MEDRSLRRSAMDMLTHVHRRATKPTINPHQKEITMIITKDSHTDHAITPVQWAHILERFKDRTSFFIETIELPEDIGTVTNDLYGPSAGDSPVLEADVFYAKRAPRAWNSRLVQRPKRQTKFVRIIAGPHEEHDCILYTAYGVPTIDGPVAPKEPGDIGSQIEELTPGYETRRCTNMLSVETHEALHKLYEQLETSKKFWSEHALAVELH